jgi:hypothetical protein
MSAAVATQNTGLIRAKCDPYGSESAIRLVGGVYPESHVGRIMWHCGNYSDGRFRAECQLGHKSGIVMPLCYSHVRSISERQMGLCPRCAWPVEAINLNNWINSAQRSLSASLMVKDLAAVRRWAQQLERMQARMTELYQTGVIKRTPLTLGEVS